MNLVQFVGHEMLSRSFCFSILATGVSMRRWTQASMFLLAMLGWSNSVYASDTPLKAALPQLSPWSYLESRQPTGIVPEILEELAREMGRSIDITIVPYARMVQMQALGETDLSVSFQPVAESESGDFVADIYPLQSVVFVKSGAAQQDPVHPIAVASIRGALYNEDMTRSKRYQLILTNDHEHSIRLVLAGRADGLAGPKDQLEFLLDQRLDKTQKFEQIDQIGADKVWLQISKKGAGYSELARIKAAMAKLHSEGTVTYIVEKHLAEWGYMYPD